MIEYSGNVIRSILTDKREKYYDSKVSRGLLQKLLQTGAGLGSGSEGRTGLGRVMEHHELGLPTSGDIFVLAGALEALLIFCGLGRVSVHA